jgi:hypothetical protein
MHDSRWGSIELLYEQLVIISKVQSCSFLMHRYKVVPERIGVPFYLQLFSTPAEVRT